MTRIYVPQPIPEAAETRLRACGEVTIYPHVGEVDQDQRESRQ